MRYVALLRGVNVGGSGKIDMRELKDVFAAAGMASVRTHINSGNVVFTSDDADRARLTGTLEAAIESRCGFPVALVVRSADEMRSIVSAMPEDWANNGDWRCDVVFLWDEVDGPETLRELDLDPEVEDARYTPGAIVRRVERKKAGRSKLVRIVGTPLYRQVTVRNCNTARKLLEIVEE